MTTQNVITNWQAEIARIEQHSKATTALLQKTTKVLNVVMMNALRAGKKEYYDRLRVLMTHGYTLVGKTRFDRMSEIVHEQASLALPEVTATDNMHRTYTAADLQELKTLIDEYRATLEKPRKITPKQQAKVDLVLKDLESWSV